MFRRRSRIRLRSAPRWARAFLCAAFVCMYSACKRPAAQQEAASEAQGGAAARGRDSPSPAAFAPGIAAGETPARREIASTGTSAQDEPDALATEVAREVERIRRRSFRRPVPVATWSSEQWQAHHARELEVQPQIGGSIELHLIAQKMVGLESPKTTTQEVTSAPAMIAVYLPREKACRFIEGVPRPGGPLMRRVHLAHELTHALDDQYFDLLRFHSERELTSDSRFFSLALTEGSATLTELQYLTARVAGDLDRLESTPSWEVIEPARERFFQSIIARRAMARSQDYTLGANFLLRGDWTLVYREEAYELLRERVEAAFQSPPRSSEQVIYPEKYWDAGQRDEPVVVSDAAMEARLASAGLQVIYRNTFGEHNCALMATSGVGSLRLEWVQERRGGMRMEASTAARGWGGDRFYILRGAWLAPDAPITLTSARGLWLTFWDSREARDAFVKNYEEHMGAPPRAMFPFGARGALLLVGFREPERSQVAEFVLADLPRLTQGAQVVDP